MLFQHETERTFFLIKEVFFPKINSKSFSIFSSQIFLFSRNIFFFKLHLTVSNLKKEIGLFWMKGKKVTCLSFLTRPKYSNKVIGSLLIELLKAWNIQLVLTIFLYSWSELSEIVLKVYFKCKVNWNKLFKMQSWKWFSISYLKWKISIWKIFWQNTKLFSNMYFIQNDWQA